MDLKSSILKELSDAGLGDIADNYDDPIFDAGLIIDDLQRRVDKIQELPINETTDKERRLVQIIGRWY
jgi:hypothetical protein